MTLKLSTCLFGLLLTILSNAVLAEFTINVNKLNAAPTLDGSANDWSSVKAVKIPLTQILADSKSIVPWVELRAGHFNSDVFFFARWPDDSEDVIHKSYIWDEERGRYGKGKANEDRFALQFRMSGDYTTDWASGNAFTADMWHWKASRSEPLGLAHDKSTIISKEKLLKAYKLETKDGGYVYLKRPGDAGDKLYSTKRYGRKEQDVMPKYILTENAGGSVADIKTKAVWANGYWHLEIKRALNTQQDDDVSFELGKAVLGGIAIFNHTGNDDHSVSETLNFQF